MLKLRKKKDKDKEYKKLLDTSKRTKTSTEMYCPNCGCELIEEDHYCQNCDNVLPY